MYTELTTLREHTGTQPLFHLSDKTEIPSAPVRALATAEDWNQEITWYLGMFKVEVLPEEKIPGNNTYMIACRIRVGAQILFDDTFTFTRPFPIGGAHYELDPLISTVMLTIDNTRFAIQQLFVYGIGMQHRRFEAQLRDSIQLNFYDFFNRVRHDYTKLKPESTYMGAF